MLYRGLIRSGPVGKGGGRRVIGVRIERGPQGAYPKGGYGPCWGSAAEYIKINLEKQLLSRL